MKRENIMRREQSSQVKDPVNKINGIIKRLEEEVNAYKSLLKRYGTTYEKIEKDNYPENLDHVSIENISKTYGKIRGIEHCLELMRNEKN